MCRCLCLACISTSACSALLAPTPPPQLVQEVPLHSKRGGGEGTFTWGTFPRGGGVREPSRGGVSCTRGGGAPSVPQPVPAPVPVYLALPTPVHPPRPCGYAPPPCLCPLPAPVPMPLGAHAPALLPTPTGWTGRRICPCLCLCSSNPGTRSRPSAECRRRARSTRCCTGPLSGPDPRSCSKGRRRRRTRRTRPPRYCVPGCGAVVRLWSPRDCVLSGLTPTRTCQQLVTLCIWDAFVGVAAWGCAGGGKW